MTRFWRDGFYRTNAYGTTSWVEGHWVDRDNWEKESGGPSYRDFFLKQLQENRASGSKTAQFVNPNANCPVCDKPVFFYQNIHGSRVFFDELGPPWPKHPCTNNPYNETTISDDNLVEFIKPDFRSEDEISNLLRWVNYADTYPDTTFEIKFGEKPWLITSLADRFKCASGVFFILTTLELDSKKKIFLFRKALPRFLKPGAIVFYDKGKVTFLNPDSLEPVELSVQRIRNASQFIDELLIARNNQVGS